MEMTNKDGVNALTALDHSVHNVCLRAGMSEGFSHLLRLRASQLNGCAYCLRLHTQSAMAAGESAERIALIAVAQRCDYFSKAESAALALLEWATIPTGNMSTIERDLPSLWREAVLWTAIIINAWNRYSLANAQRISP